MKNLFIAFFVLTLTSAQIASAEPKTKLPHHRAAINYLAGYLGISANDVNSGDFENNSMPKDKIQEIYGWYEKDENKFDCFFSVDRDTVLVQKMNCTKQR